MKATDLMIGDWVMTGIDIAQVAAIDERGIYVDDPISTCLVHVDFRFVKPILLTGEILKKNGFKLVTLKDSTIQIHDWLAYRDVFTMCCLLYDKIYEFYNLILSDNDNKIIHIFCVHELQHAMRVCGIKKEIEL